MFIFCKIIKGEAHSYKVLESAHALAFLDIHPISRYHTLVIPKKHTENIFDIAEEAMVELNVLVRKVCKLYEDKLGIKNIQILSNNGKAAQQDVFHMHYDIIPRMDGDNQNMKWKTW